MLFHLLVTSFSVTYYKLTLYVTFDKRIHINLSKEVEAHCRLLSDDYASFGRLEPAPFTSGRQDADHLISIGSLGALVFHFFIFWSTVHHGSVANSDEYLVI